MLPTLAAIDGEFISVPQYLADTFDRLFGPTAEAVDSDPTPPHGIERPNIERRAS